uniref:Uncharacterized protein n=1 Tax=Anguilla anguilla TaxID=7936 RepID=A0A0E9U8T5_ANGAN
MSGADEEIFQ